MVETADSAYAGSSVETTPLTGRQSVAWLPSQHAGTHFSDPGGMKAGWTLTNMPEVFRNYPCCASVLGPWFRTHDSNHVPHMKAEPRPTRPCRRFYIFEGDGFSAK